MCIDTSPVPPASLNFHLLHFDSANYLLWASLVPKLYDIEVDMNTISCPEVTF